MPKAQVIEHENGDKEVKRTLTKSISGKPQLLMMGEVEPGDEVSLTAHKGGKKWTVEKIGK